MKHLLNNLSSEEKNRIREQYEGGMSIDTSKFKKLLETKLGDTKPLVNEDFTIDGVEVEHYNVNYVLRGLEIPKGSHRVEFIFNPSVVKIGSNIALGSTILLLMLVLGQGLLIYRKRL